MNAWGYEKNQSALRDRLAVFFARAWPYLFLGLLTASLILFGDLAELYFSAAAGG